VARAVDLPVKIPVVQVVWNSFEEACLAGLFSSPLVPHAPGATHDLPNRPALRRAVDRFVRALFRCRILPVRKRSKLGIPRTQCLMTH
jgi:hypothetical protein